MAIITPDDIKAYIGRGSSISAADADALTLLQALAEADVQEELGFRIARASHTEYYPESNAQYREYGFEEVEVQGNKAFFMRGAQGPKFKLRQTPVRAITSINVDSTGYFGQGADSFGAASLLTAGTDYYYVIDYEGMSRCGHVIRRGLAWPGEPGSIKVVYESGFSTAELDGDYANFKAAIMLTFADYWNRYQQLRVGQAGKEVTNENIGGGVSASYLTEYCGQYGIPDTAMEKISGWVDFSGLSL